MAKGTHDWQTASMEDYLETVVMLKEQGKPVTVTAISQMMNVKKPSVDWALRRLSEAGLILHEKYRDVDLTAEGAKIAEQVYHRHKVLRRFLVEVLDVTPETAEVDACRMEHNLSRESINRLEKFVSFVLEFHPGLSDWSDIFDRYIKHGKNDSGLKERLGIR